MHITHCKKNLPTAILSIPISNLNVSVESPLILLVSSVVRFKAANRSSYDLPFNAGTILLSFSEPSLINLYLRAKMVSTE